ncbi:MAG: tol-pal system protein YbgF [Thermodesulfobacteriota bacterium]|nr:tol-pal system protein YbgF [Thermodesulfobacteriota bacterium]
MKNLIILSLVLIFTCTGCATQEDLLRVEGHFGAKIADLQKDTSDLRESIKSTRKSQANVDADTIGLRDSVQKLRGTTERLKVKIAALEAKTKEKNLNDSLADISNRLEYLESSLGMDKGGNQKGEVEKEKPLPIKKGEVTGKEEAYSNAYRIFKNGKYDLAKEEFQKFLKFFPDTEYSDNAQFWIGECDYFEGRYEEAIVEYDGVIQNYPKGNKVPSAFLKQALSFLKLGDKTSAKLLLQRIIKDYPNTTPARVARKRLVNIK